MLAHNHIYIMYICGYGRSTINGSVGENGRRNATLYVMKSLIYAPKLSGLNANLFGQVKARLFRCFTETRLKFDDEVTQPEVPAAPKEQIHYERSKPTKRELPAERFKDLPVLETTELIPDAQSADPQACRAHRRRIDF